MSTVETPREPTVGRRPHEARPSKVHVADIVDLTDGAIKRLAEAAGYKSTVPDGWPQAFVDRPAEPVGSHPSLALVPPRHSMQEEVAELRKRKGAACDGPPGGTAKQHGKGKLTVRERIDYLLDPGSFVELGMLAQHGGTGLGLEANCPPTDGVVTGWGTIDGRVTFVFGHDFRVFGGALGEMFASKIQKVMDLAESAGAPIVGLNDGGGARIQEGVSALVGFGEVFRRNVRLSGVVPQISVVLGPCAGGAVYSPALTDFIFMVEGSSQMYITGPDVIAAATGEHITHDELGGAATHATRSGVASFVAADEQSCLDDVRYLLSFLPPNNGELPPYRPPSDDPDRRCEELIELVPSAPDRPYDMHLVIAEIVDDGEFFEIQPDWACNIVCALARMDGHVVGIVANQPIVLAGALDINASEKAARFVRTCDAFNISLISLVDVPGFLPGALQEYGGIIRHGAKLLYAYCEATVPRVQVVLRKAFGGAYIVMESKSIGADLSFVWPGNQIAVMGAAGAVNIVFRKELAAADDKARRRQALVELYADNLMDSYGTVQRGFVDDVIDPADTRRILIRSLHMLRTKREGLVARKHGNQPC